LRVEKMGILKKAGLTLCAILGISAIANAKINKEQTDADTSQYTIIKNDTSVYDSIDVAVAQNFGINPVDFGSTHTFYTPSGTRYDIKMAVITSNDTLPGGIMSGYARLEDLSPEQMTVLTDSLPGTCFSVLSITDPPEVYEQNATDHWTDCGYFPTSTNSIQPNNNNFNVYPNPFIKEINVSGKNISSVKMLDSSGNMVYENNDVNNNFYTIQPTNLKPGVYIIITNNESTNKVIKK
jgi:hypothetical protein